MFVLLLATSVGCSLAQTVQAPSKQPTAEDKKKQAEAEKERQMRREVDIQNLVLSANSQPIEIAVDILARALDANLVKDPKRKREIIEDIFFRASEAKEPIRLVYYGGLNDTRPGYRSLPMSYSEMDQLSIQLRAVRLMMEVDKLRARQMFTDIPNLKLPSQSCEEVLTYATSDYYKVLKEIADQTFDPEARRRKEHIYFAASYVESIDSPSQVVRVIEFLRSMKVAPTDFSILLDSLTTSLRKIVPSPRGFALSMSERLTTEMQTLITRDIKDRSTELNQLAKAYRQYLAKHLSGTQCADNLFAGSPGKLDPEVEAANALFEFPLAEEDVKPEKIDPEPKVFHYWKRTKSAKLLTGLKELRFGNMENRVPLPLTDRSTQEWQQKLMKFLEQMDGWKPEDEETEIDYLHQKCVLYDGLVDLAPPGVLRSDLLRNYAMFLRDSRIQKENPGQWLFYMKLVLKTGKELKGKDLDDFMNTLNNSGNPVFTLYIELDRLLATAVPASKTVKH